ncbi:HAD family hydrolase [Nannocystis pusilla]|uniref:HAD family hydrolase n=1 Tax=Nannocystis pusilla TaxID=889268 RepID=A0ABS7TU80_9BACT|nr:HAD family hydrolase [Nannocystis pusilla]MBZ5711763.1 HAD family hydrolase [Nannocystis pusilla]
MNSGEHTVFLIDVDNTLLDNDAVQADLCAHLDRSLGACNCREYFAVLEELRAELGYVDYLGTLQRYRARHVDDQSLLAVSHFLLDYPFPTRLFAGVLELLAGLRRRGEVVILSDGDVVFQPHKIRRSGLWEAVDGRVLIYVHKELRLDDVARRHPADHYVLIDDKLRILSACKQAWGERLTTVWVRQGHYARTPGHTEGLPAPDVAVEAIAEVLDGLPGASTVR